MAKNPLIERLLIRHEGVELEAYFDTVGKQTIGVGYNLTDRGTDDLELTIGRQFDGRLTYDEAIAVLREDIERTYSWLDFKYPWFPKLNEPRQAAIADMTFNLGRKGFAGFKNTIKFLREGNYKRAADNMLLSKWASQVKGRARRLATIVRIGEEPADV